MSYKIYAGAQDILETIYDLKALPKSSLDEGQVMVVREVELSHGANSTFPGWGDPQPGGDNHPKWVPNDAGQAQVQIEINDSNNVFGTFEADSSYNGSSSPNPWGNGIDVIISRLDGVGSISAYWYDAAQSPWGSNDAIEIQVDQDQASALTLDDLKIAVNTAGSGKISLDLGGATPSELIEIAGLGNAQMQFYSLSGGGSGTGEAFAEFRLFQPSPAGYPDWWQVEWKVTGTSRKMLAYQISFNTTCSDCMISSMSVDGLPIQNWNNTAAISGQQIMGISFSGNSIDVPTSGWSTLTGFNLDSSNPNCDPMGLSICDARIVCTPGIDEWPYDTPQPATGPSTFASYTHSFTTDEILFEAGFNHPGPNGHGIKVVAIDSADGDCHADFNTTNINTLTIEIANDGLATVQDIIDAVTGLGGADVTATAVSLATEIIASAGDTDGLDTPQTIVWDPVGAQVEGDLIADVNGDGLINIVDVVAYISAWGNSDVGDQDILGVNFSGGGTVENLAFMIQRILLGEWFGEMVYQENAPQMLKTYPEQSQYPPQEEFDCGCDSCHKMPVTYYWDPEATMHALLLAMSCTPRIGPGEPMPPIISGITGGNLQSPFFEPGHGQIMGLYRFIVTSVDDDREYLDNGTNYTDVPGRWVALNHVCMLRLSMLEDQMSYAMNSGNLQFSQSFVPTQHDSFDIGSAPKKVRDIYVEGNSIWVGDDYVISGIDDSGVIKKKKRKNQTPARLNQHIITKMSKHNGQVMDAVQVENDLKVRYYDRNKTYTAIKDTDVYNKVGADNLSNEEKTQLGDRIGVDLSTEAREIMLERLDLNIGLADWVDIAQAEGMTVQTPADLFIEDDFEDAPGEIWQFLDKIPEPPDYDERLTYYTLNPGDGSSTPDELARAELTSYQDNLIKYFGSWLLQLKLGADSPDRSQKAMLTANRYAASSD